MLCLISPLRRPLASAAIAKGQTMEACMGVHVRPNDKVFIDLSQGAVCDIICKGPIAFLYSPVCNDSVLLLIELYNHLQEV